MKNTERVTLSPTGGRLTTFSMTRQQYGAFFNGFAWDAYATFTYSQRKDGEAAEKTLRNYIVELSEGIRKRTQGGPAAIAYVAVPEYRYSGLGMPSIRLHWHVLMAVAPWYRTALLHSAQEVWEKLYGGAKVEAYDSANDAAYYVAKTTNADFSYVVDRLDRASYHGEKDLYARFQTDPYVPDHVRHMTHAETLVLRPYEPPKGF